MALRRLVVTRKFQPWRRSERFRAARWPQTGGRFSAVWRDLWRQGLNAVLGAMATFALAAGPAIAGGQPLCTTPTPQGVDGFTVAAATRFGLPTDWIKAVMAIESAGQICAVSPKGALGLMQIMPHTYAALRRQYSLGPNPFDARDNIIAGAGYLRALYDQFGLEGALTAYNAGPRRWLDHRLKGQELPKETEAYLTKLRGVLRDINEPLDERAPNSLFVLGPSGALLAGRRDVAPVGDGKAPISAPRSHVGLEPAATGLFVSTSAQTSAKPPAVDLSLTPAP